MFQIDNLIFYPSPIDKGRMARFYNEEVLNKIDTELKKEPVYNIKVMCEIRTTGSRDVFRCPVRAKDIQDFPEAWRAFNGEAVNIPTGRALTDISCIDQMQSIFYLSKGIRTLEQLADISDGAISSYGSGAWIHRDKARKEIGWTVEQGDRKRDEEMLQMRERMKALEAALAERNADKEIAAIDAAEKAEPKRRARRKPLKRVATNDTVKHSAANLQ